MMRRFIFLLLICFLLSLLPLNAQDAPLPLIAVKEDGIYAVNPLDGTADLLVTAPDDYETIFSYTYSPVILSTAEWLSPDGQFLAYRVIAPQNPDEAITEDSYFTQNFFVLDLQNPDSPIAINFDGDFTRVESVTWSFDNTLLFVLANNTLNMIDRETWTIQTTVDAGSPNASQMSLLARKIFAIEDGVVMLDTAENDLALEFTVFDSEGNQLRDFAVDWSLSPDVNLYMNTPFTPLEIDGHVMYGFVDFYAVYLLFQADFATGEISDGDYSTPAMLSRSAVDTSLRLFVSLPSDTYTGLLIFDNENNMLDMLEMLPLFAHGIPGGHIGSTFALSPDGQQLAYLENGNVMIWENSERRSLDFSAQILIWSSPVYMPFSVDYFRG